jgi:hypothetical protein
VGAPFAGLAGAAWVSGVGWPLGPVPGASPLASGELGADLRGPRGAGRGRRGRAARRARGSRWGRRAAVAGEREVAGAGSSASSHGSPRTWRTATRSRGLSAPSQAGPQAARASRSAAPTARPSSEVVAPGTASGDGERGPGLAVGEVAAGLGVGEVLGVREALGVGLGEREAGDLEGLIVVAAERTQAREQQQLGQAAGVDAAARGPQRGDRDAGLARLEAQVRAGARGARGPAAVGFADLAFGTGGLELSLGTGAALAGSAERRPGRAAPRRCRCRGRRSARARRWAGRRPARRPASSSRRPRGRRRRARAA